MANEQILTDKIVGRILDIRESGLYNMFSIQEVQREAHERGYYELVMLLEEHKDIYVEFILSGKRQ